MLVLIDQIIEYILLTQGFKSEGSLELDYHSYHELVKELHDKDSSIQFSVLEKIDIKGVTLKIRVLDEFSQKRIINFSL